MNIDFKTDDHLKEKKSDFAIALPISINWITIEHSWQNTSINKQLESGLEWPDLQFFNTSQPPTLQ